MAECKICGRPYRSLVSHIQVKHGLTSEQYRNLYPGAILVDPDVVDQRAKKRAESLDEIKKKTKQAFSKYEGGHPSRDPKVQAVRAFNRELFGSHYDTESRKATMREKYGVEHNSQTEEARERSRLLMRALNASGKSRRLEKPRPSEEELKAQLGEGKRVGDIAVEWSVSLPTVTKWIREAGLEAPRVQRSTRGAYSLEETLEGYLAMCQERGCRVPFAEYQRSIDPAGTSEQSKLKRYFKRHPEKLP